MAFIVSNCIARHQFGVGGRTESDDRAGTGLGCPIADPGARPRQSIGADANAADFVAGEIRSARARKCGWSGNSSFPMVSQCWMIPDDYAYIVDPKAKKKSKRSDD